MWPLGYGERATLKALARQGPQPLVYQHYRRWRCAAYGCPKTWLWWFAEPALQALPPPADGLLSRVGDRTLTGTRGSKHPVAHKTRLSQYQPDVFGFRIVLLRAPWEVSRIPLDVALSRRQADPDDHTETALCRQLLPAFRRPTWGQAVVVTADAAYASRAKLATLQGLGDWDARARPRTWKFTQRKAVKDVVTHLPRGTSTQLRLPTVRTPRRRTLWVYTTRVQLRHRGNGTVGLSTCRRHDGPNQPTILVTTRPETVTAREMVGVYRRRWWSALLLKARQGVVGMGQPQVTTHVDRVERSVAVAMMASLLWLKLRAKDIPADRPWSAFRRQRAWASEVLQGPCERSARQIARQWLKMGNAAS